MEEDRDVLEARAADVDEADPQLVEAQPEDTPDQHRDEDFFGVAFDQNHALGEE
ncbi:hypothetical protein D3C80_1134360 [compost metagenome]